MLARDPYAIAAVLHSLPPHKQFAALLAPPPAPPRPPQTALHRYTMSAFQTQADPLHVVVVGAGLGGLAAAIAIRQAGHNVTICEKAAELSEVPPPPTPSIVEGAGSGD